MCLNQMLITTINAYNVHSVDVIVIIKNAKSFYNMSLFPAVIRIAKRHSVLDQFVF